MKIWSKFNHLKFPNYQMVKIFKIKDSSYEFIILYLHHILSPNNKFGM